MFCIDQPLSQGGEGGWWWRGARLSSWHQSPVSRGKCLLMEEVSTYRCVSGYYVLELVTNIMKSFIDRYYSQIIQSIARGVHLEVSAPHAGAAETLVQGQQVQAVGVLAPLDLVAGAGLDTGLGRVSTTQGAADLAGQARAPHAGHAAQPRVEGHYHGVDTRLHHLHHLHRQILNTKLKIFTV